MMSQIKLEFLVDRYWHHLHVSCSEVIYIMLCFCHQELLGIGRSSPGGPVHPAHAPHPQGGVPQPQQQLPANRFVHRSFDGEFFGIENTS